MFNLFLIDIYPKLQVIVYFSFSCSHKSILNILVCYFHLSFYRAVHYIDPKYSSLAKITRHVLYFRFLV